ELEGVEVGNGRPGGEGTDEDAAQNVPEDERLPCRPRGGGAEDCGDEDVGEIPEKHHVAGHGERMIARGRDDPSAATSARNAHGPRSFAARERPTTRWRARDP